MVAVINPSTPWSIFTTEPVVDWALDQDNVQGQAKQSATHLTQVHLKLSQPTTYLKRWSAIFRLNDPDCAIKEDIAQRHQIVAQQRVVHLEEFILSKDVLEDAIVLTFDCGYVILIKLLTLWQIKQ